MLTVPQPSPSATEGQDEGDMVHYLVVAHQTATSPLLLRRAAEIAARDREAVFTLLVPVLAIDDALRTDPERYHAIIFSTLPPGISRWLRLDLPRRVAVYAIPVLHVIEGGDDLWAGTASLRQDLADGRRTRPSEVGPAMADAAGVQPSWRLLASVGLLLTLHIGIMLTLALRVDARFFIVEALLLGFFGVLILASRGLEGPLLPRRPRGADGRKLRAPVRVDVQQLQRDLQSSDCRLVAEAASALAAAGQHIDAATLVQARQCLLRGRRQRRRVDLARAYLHLLDPNEGSREAAHLLRSGGDPEVRDEAFHALVDQGAAAFVVLHDLIGSRDTSVRWYAYRAAHRIGGPEALALLVEGLRDQDGGSRMAAASALLDWGPEAFEPVMRAIAGHEPSRGFHLAARSVLKRITPEPAREATTPLLASLASPWTVYQSGFLARRLLDRFRGVCAGEAERFKGLATGASG